MKTHWIVVADASRARVISTVDRAINLSVEQELDHPEGRLRTQEPVSDESGRLEKSGRGILSAMDPKTDPHEEVAKHFAGKVAKLLEDGLAHNAFQSLTLVAPAHFLALLKAALTPEVAKRLDAGIAKDLTRLPSPQLREHLQKVLEYPSTRSHGD
jgi:protein required for attachment to host cells